jgi:SAM-dependent methyltransferase
MREQSKAARRRLSDLNFARWFTGNGIDIGSGGDGLSANAPLFPFIINVREWDIGDGDAQHMLGVPDDKYDFLHSSHCLEHLVDPRAALASWLRILKSGGHMIVTIPDEDMYERGHWPSSYNGDHKHTFTIWKEKSWSPVSINLVEFLALPSASIERLTVIRDLFDPGVQGDQTLGLAECSIEFVLKKL